MTWKVPQDDGGYPITGYRVEMLDIQSGTWIEITFIEGYEPRLYYIRTQWATTG